MGQSFESVTALVVQLTPDDTLRGSAYLARQQDEPYLIALSLPGLNRGRFSLLVKQPATPMLWILNAVSFPPIPLTRLCRIPWGCVLHHRPERVPLCWWEHRDPKFLAHLLPERCPILWPVFAS